MSKKLFPTLVLVSVMIFAFGACGATEGEAEAPAREESSTTGVSYGYTGDDPVEVAVYKYMVEEMSNNYAEADVSIPTVRIVAVDDSDGAEILVYGDFFIDNYNIEGDTLQCVSGGDYPGCIHVKKTGDDYAVSTMDVVADGGGFELSAREIFGENYDAFMRIYSDDDNREEVRKATVAAYVKGNDLAVTKYQDEGWPAVELDF